MHRDDLLAGVHRLAGDLDPPPVDEHAADVQQEPRLPPRQPRHARRQHLIQAASDVGFADGENDAVRGGPSARTLAGQRAAGRAFLN